MTRQEKLERALRSLVDEWPKDHVCRTCGKERSASWFTAKKLLEEQTRGLCSRCNRAYIGHACTHCGHEEPLYRGKP